MELRDLVRETRGLVPGTLSRSGAAFLLEDGSLRHETGKFKLDMTRTIDAATVAAESEIVTSDLARRRVYPVEQRDRKATAKGAWIGRDENVDVRIEIASVSGRHARIERLDRGRWALTDERSRNGTFLDGTRMRPGDTVLLRPGQVVRFGPEVKLTFLDGDMMENMLRQLDPMLAKALGQGERKTVAGVPLPAYLDDDSQSGPPVAPSADAPRRPVAPTRVLPNPGILAEQTGALPQPLALDQKGNPGVPSGATRGLAPALVAGRESSLAVVCPPYPPIGLMTGIPVTVGRVPGNDLILPHPNVSRTHARFERKGDRVGVVDLKSANGTLVRGERVTRVELSIGSRVQIGPYEIQILPTPAEPPGKGQGPDISTRVMKPV